MSADVVRIHEAAHAVVARILGAEILRAAAGKDAVVTTRHRRGSTAAEEAASAAKSALISLAGPAAERRWAGAIDARNAADHALRIVQLRRGLDGGAEVTAEVRREVAAVLEKLRRQAESLVSEAGPLIDRVAAAFADGPLSQAQIDALLELDT